MIDSRIMRLVGRVTHMGNNKNECRILLKKVRKEETTRKIWTYVVRYQIGS
jgi:hypothetical protein